MKKLFRLVLACAIPLITEAQNVKEKTYLDLLEVDKYVLNNVKSTGSIKSLAKEFTDRFGTEEEIVRAIFRWMAENIAYDCASLKEKPVMESKVFYDPESIKKWIEEENRNLAEATLRKRKAVCEGYSQLFKALCQESDIRCEVIHGYARSYENQIGKVTKTLNHTWNAVYYNDRWNLMDVTWASGHLNREKDKFNKEFEDFYFATPPELFILDHRPKDDKWQLLERPVGLEDFCGQPHFEKKFFRNNVRSVSPNCGLVKLKSKEKLVIELDCEKEFSNISSAIGKKDCSNNFIWRRDGSKYILETRFVEIGNFLFTIYLDYSPAITYRVTVEK